VYSTQGGRLRLEHAAKPETVAGAMVFAEMVTNADRGFFTLLRLFCRSPTIQTIPARFLSGNLEAVVLSPSESARAFHMMYTPPAPHPGCGRDMTCVPEAPNSTRPSTAVVLGGKPSHLPSVGGPALVCPPYSLTYPTLCFFSSFFSPLPPGSSFFPTLYLFFSFPLLHLTHPLRYLPPLDHPLAPHVSFRALLSLIFCFLLLVPSSHGLYYVSSPPSISSFILPPY